MLLMFRGILKEDCNLKFLWIMCYSINICVVPRFFLMRRRRPRQLQFHTVFIE